MFRTTDMVLIAVMVSAAAFTYTTKHGAEAELAKVRNLEQSIRFEEETIRVLNADWSLLTQPSRLQRLSEFYDEQLGLAPMEAHQFAGLGELPPPRPVREIDLDELLRSIADNDDGGIVTGGIAR